jgi:peptidase E
MVRYVLGLVPRRRPRVCFLPTASGDAPDYIVEFYEAFSSELCEPSHLALFGRPGQMETPRARLLSQDLIFVGGGNTANMLAVWRQHGIDAVLRGAWESGIVLCGASAGSLCWFQGGVTDSFGVTLQPLADGLGFLAGSHCPHFDGEPERRPTYLRCVREGLLPAGLAVDDGVAAHFVGTRLAEVVTTRMGAGAYEVVPAGGDAEVRSLADRTRYVGFE